MPLLLEQQSNLEQLYAKLCNKARPQEIRRNVYQMDTHLKTNGLGEKVKHNITEAIKSGEL